MRIEIERIVEKEKRCRRIEKLMIDEKFWKKYPNAIVNFQRMKIKFLPGSMEYVVRVEALRVEGFVLELTLRDAASLLDYQ